LARVHVVYPSLSRADVVERLRGVRIRLQKTLPISRMILFGSYARSLHTAGSDIDVVVVYEGPERDAAYKMIMDETRLPRLELRVYNEEQFASSLVASPMFAKVLAEEGIEIVGTGD
jgi:predicted nucleotidyltransferase